MPSRPQGVEVETPEQRSERMRQVARARWDAVRDAKRVQAQVQEEAAQAASTDAGGSDGGAPQSGTAPVAGQSSATDDRVALVRVPIPIGNIMRKLSTEAQAGETSAARELRAWLSQFPPDVDAADVGDLDRVTRTAIAAILARALAEHEESLQAHTFEEGTQDAFASALDQEAVQPVGHPRGDGSHPNDRGSRPPEAIEEPSAPYAPPATTLEKERVPSPDGTGPHQMDVDECIEEASKDDS